MLPYLLREDFWEYIRTGTKMHMGIECAFCGAPFSGFESQLTDYLRVSSSGGTGWIAEDPELEKKYGTDVTTKIRC